MKTLSPALLLLAFLLPGCDHEDATAPLTGDAYAAAARTPLGDVAPLELPGLHNVFRLSPTIVSGAEPQGEKAFAELQRMGVKTVLSVDGKAPDTQTASRHGMRYVHVPIQYKAVTPDEMIRIVKTFRELEPPFYVHCFHGKHRGPAAAAIGRIALDGAPRKQALAEMRQWCGTSKKYGGLYRDIASRTFPTEAESRALVWNFPARAKLEGYRHAMVEAARAFDNLILLAERGWKADPDHPDVDARNEAEKLAEIMAQAAKMPRAGLTDEFRRWSDDSAKAGRALHGHLEALAGGDETARARADEAYKAVKHSCTQCHAAYRNE
jgi:protein tyrosine phosphatase (PTP) superfamily phosphohydrolase (DUF442 family)